MRRWSTTQLKGLNSCLGGQAPLGHTEKLSTPIAKAALNWFGAVFRYLLAPIEYHSLPTHDYGFRLSLVHLGPRWRTSGTPVIPPIGGGCFILGTRVLSNRVGTTARRTAVTGDDGQAGGLGGNCMRRNRIDAEAVDPPVVNRQPWRVVQIRAALHCHENRRLWWPDPD